MKDEILNNTELRELPIGPEEVAEAAAILQKYKAGKAALDKRLVDNELWFRMGHWKNYQNPMMPGKAQPSSGWLFNSIANMAGTATTIIVIMASASFARRFGKKAVAVAGFALSTASAFAFYLLQPTQVAGMIGMTILGAAVYAPTVPLVWAIFADVADYSELTTGRRFTGMVFATIGFCLKAGLALGETGIS